MTELDVSVVLEVDVLLEMESDVTIFELESESTEAVPAAFRSRRHLCDTVFSTLRP